LTAVPGQQLDQVPDGGFLVGGTVPTSSMSRPRATTIRC